MYVELRGFYGWKFAATGHTEKKMEKNLALKERYHVMHPGLSALCCNGEHISTRTFYHLFEYK